MAKLTLTDLANLQNETTAVNAINANSALIETAIENTLSRDGTSPNRMGATLDMDSNRILNLPAPVNANEPLRLQDLTDFVGGTLDLGALPDGGTTGQVLTKQSNMDGDADWETTSGISNHSVTLANLVQGSAKSFIGVTGNATADHADITGSANQIPIINNAGTALAFTTLSGDVTNATGVVTIANNAVSNAKLATAAANTLKGNVTGSSAVPTDFTLASLTNKVTPDGADLLLIYDVAGTALKKATVTSVAAGGTVATVNGQTGAVVVSVTKQIFDADGTYTPTTDMVSCIVECWGAGGGGGGTAGGQPGFTTGGAGGGAGGYSRKYCTAADIGASKAVTIGVGGGGGSSGTNTGSTGGNTSLGSLCIALGGSGGEGGGGSGTSSQGGPGGAAGTGDVTGVGSYGGSMVTIGVGGGGWSGFGGSTLVGAGGGQKVTATSATGIAGTGYGSGGSGGASSSGAAAAAGGAGANGLVVITEFVVTS